MIWLFLFTFGICIGSFLNVLIDRLPNNRNPFKGRSKCDHCQKILSAIDLIPVFSFIFLKAKCRYCHKKLSFQYPLIEIFTGLMFVGLYLWLISSNQQFVNYQLSIINYQLFFVFLSYISLITIFSSFLVIFVADVKYQIIPDEMLLSLLFSTLSYHFFSHIMIYDNLLSGLGALIFFLVIFLFTKGRGMGFGDVKMSFVIGLLLGFPKIIVALYLAFLTGAVISIILILLRKKSLKNTIAFGPFLILGSAVSFFWGNYFWLWYQGFFN